MVISFSRWATAWILALLLTKIQVHGQSPSDQFVSIDCGWLSEGNGSYSDNTTGITYSTDYDRKFVVGGLGHGILPEFTVGKKYQLWNGQQRTLRSFPNGSRNCYTLPSTSGKRYLLRAFFTYGNYDGLNRTMDGSPFLFGLHIGVNFWQAVNLTNWDPSETMWKEVLTISPGNSLSVCLINFGSGTPFVSSLELRPLDNGTYPFLDASVSVSYIQRYRFGNITDFITRYPTDKYDRFWQSWALTVPDYSYPLISLNTRRPVNNSLSVDGYQLPQPILQNASTIDTNYSSMTISVSVDPNIDVRRMKLLPIFHFAEIGSDNPNRTFNVYGASELLFPYVYPLPPLQIVSRYPTHRFLRGNNYISFSLNKTANSALPPLINAFELYSLIRMENFTTSSDDADYINEVKKHYELELLNWNGDPCSPKEYTWEGLTCDYFNANTNPRIVRVNMSTSGLTGGIAISFFNMTSLQNLDLSHNNLTGLIPEYQLMSIKFLNLSKNNLHGPIPDSILQRVQAGLLELRLEGNPVCSNNTDTYCSDKKKKMNMTDILLIAVIVPVVLISLLVGMCILWKLYLKEKLGNHEDYAMYEEETPLHIDIRRFTYAELKLITNNFQSIIGKGGFGIVYHGILENSDEVAVKVLMKTSISESTDFLAEVQTLSKVHHKNLVTLQGYCQNRKCLALVYEFMPRGNLQQLLRGGEEYMLSWEQRLHIAFDAAQGLGYLHELCTPPIVHRDVKTPNILLDKNLSGIISDFGLSRAFNDAHTHISTVVAGTLGYLDPEYHARFQLTVKTDVYSFGIVLLEIITGQPPVVMDPEPVHLPSWVCQKISKGSIRDVVDKRLLDKYDVNSLHGVINLAMNCVENASIDRPTMTEVISRLKVWLPAISGEKIGSPRYRNSMDTVIPKQFQLMISRVSNEGSSFQPSFAGEIQ